MNFFHALWPFGTAANPNESGSAPTQSQTGADGGSANTDADAANTDADAASTDGVTASTGTVAGGIGERPVLAGRLVWNPRTLACEWELPEGVAPLIPQDDAEPWFPEVADEHAHELHEALIAWGYGGQNVPYLELLELYKVICRRLRFEPGPWIKVGAAMRRITKGRKTSPWVKWDDGISRRVRMYKIPIELPAQKLLIMPGLPGGPSLKHCHVPNFAEVRAA